MLRAARYERKGLACRGLGTRVEGYLQGSALLSVLQSLLPVWSIPSCEALRYDSPPFITLL